MRHALRQSVPFSSIRTVTVGFGISPNLLTPPKPAGARGLRRSNRPHRRGGISPPPDAGRGRGRGAGEPPTPAGGDFPPPPRTSAGQWPSRRHYEHAG